MIFNILNSFDRNIHLRSQIFLAHFPCSSRFKMPLGVGSSRKRLGIGASSSGAFALAESVVARRRITPQAKPSPNSAPSTVNTRGSSSVGLATASDPTALAAAWPTTRPINMRPTAMPFVHTFSLSPGDALLPTPVEDPLTYLVRAASRVVVEANTVLSGRVSRGPGQPPPLK